MRVAHVACMRTAALFSIALPLLLAACSDEGASPQPLNLAPSATASAVPSAPPPPVLGKPIAKGVWALDGLSLTANASDLAPVHALVDGAEIVGIGESWHTTGTQHASRNRLIRYLVENEGFRLVMLETPWWVAQEATAYVAGRIDDVSRSTRSIFGVFASTAMQELFTWLREWNVRHPSDQVQFTGFDVQESAELGKGIRDFISRVAPSRQAELTGFMPSCYCGAANDSFTCVDVNVPMEQFPAERDRTCQAGLDKLEAAFIHDEAQFAAASDPRSLAIMKLSLRNFRANQRCVAAMPSAEGFLARDRGMHDSVLGLRELYGPTAKAVLIAHNAHLDRSSENTWLTGQGVPHQRAMGAMLRASLGTKYRAIGQYSFETGINWGGQSQPKPNTNPDSLEKLLHDKGQPLMLLDLADNEFVPAGQKYSVDPQGERMVKFVPSNTFDALLYVDKSEPMVNAP